MLINCLQIIIIFIHLVYGGTRYLLQNPLVLKDIELFICCLYRISLLYFVYFKFKGLIGLDQRFILLLHFILYQYTISLKYILFAIDNYSHCSTYIIYSINPKCIIKYLTRKTFFVSSDQMMNERRNAFY